MNKEEEIAYIQGMRDVAEIYKAKDRPSLRDQFAMAALTTVHPIISLMNSKELEGILKDDPHAAVAKMAYQLADAMLKAREVKDE